MTMSTTPSNQYERSGGLLCVFVEFNSLNCARLSICNVPSAVFALQRQAEGTEDKSVIRSRSGGRRKAEEWCVYIFCYCARQGEEAPPAQRGCVAISLHAERAEENRQRAEAKMEILPPSDRVPSPRLVRWNCGARTHFDGKLISGPACRRVVCARGDTFANDYFRNDRNQERKKWSLLLLLVSLASVVVAARLENPFGEKKEPERETLISDERIRARRDGRHGAHGPRSPVETERLRKGDKQMRPPRRGLNTYRN